MTGGAPAILAAERHREIVGNTAGGVSQCSASAGGPERDSPRSGFVVTLKRKNGQCCTVLDCNKNEMKGLGNLL